MDILEVKNLTHSYKDGASKREVLKDINLKFENGKFYSILGESGSRQNNTFIINGSFGKSSNRRDSI